MCNFVPGSALPIFKSYLAKAVALELSETLSVYWLAQLVRAVLTAKTLAYSIAVSLLRLTKTTRVLQFLLQFRSFKVYW